MSQHPVRGAPRSSSVVLRVVCLAGLVAASSASSALGTDATSGPVPPGYSMALTGGMHDFDYFIGGWSTQQRRLKARGVGSSDWEEFPAVECLSLYLDGQATVDELYMPTKHRAGLTVRAFDLGKRQW